MLELKKEKQKVIEYQELANSKELEIVKLRESLADKNILLQNSEQKNQFRLEVETGLQKKLKKANNELKVLKKENFEKDQKDKSEHLPL